MMRKQLRVTRHGAAGLAGLTAVALLAAGCSSGGGGATASGTSTDTSGVTITVALSTDPPPAADLAAFTKQTGIKVTWASSDWDSLQTKISAAATANTYFADVTNVDWSRVGQLGKLGWFQPLEKYLDASALKADMPQLGSFTLGGHIVGVPYDSSYMVTTVNTDLFTKAGITTMPTTIDEYTNDLKQIKSKGVVEYPLNIPFAAAEGLSTYWYETTNAFGGTVLDASGKPQFTDPSSPGYKAAQWMVDAIKNGLVPPGNINVNDAQGEQTLMAQGMAASTFSDYSGLINSLYNVTDSSKVTGKIHRVTDTGKPAPGNPFIGKPGADPTIWSYGHRNPEGLAFNPVDGHLWETEHGPTGGDEVNVIKKGANYGWGVISHGIEPGIMEISHDGMEEPKTFFNPSIGPGGITFYSGNRYPKWKNNLFVTGMVGQKLIRMVVKKDAIVQQETLLDHVGRVRDIIQGPDGYLYILLQNPTGTPASSGIAAGDAGMVVRLVPL